MIRSQSPRLVELGCEYELGLRISREVNGTLEWLILHLMSFLRHPFIFVSYAQDLVNCLVNAKNVRKFITKPVR